MAATNPETLIQALHQRYEQAAFASVAAEEAQPSEADDPALHLALGRVYDGLMEEIDAIRALILQQMPIDDADLTILMFHAYMLAEFMTSQASPTEEDVKLMFGAVRWAFDYLMSEGRLDDVTAGTNTLAIAQLARIACRQSTYGVAEEVAA